MTKIIRLIKRNIALSAALLLAVVTSFIVTPDKEYVTYFDFKTLTCLFCVLAVVCALKNVNFFYILAKKIVKKFGTARKCVIALVYITFIGSMLIANDMALLTILPLGDFVLDTADKKQYMAFTFIMQNNAANLGGMLTPFGNPQNLYLYTKFNIPTVEFMHIMLLPFVLSIALITVCCIVFVRNEKLSLSEDGEKFDVKRTSLYLVLFVYAIAIVFRSIPYWTGLIVIPLVLVFADRKALRMVDYGLLFTFVAFFVFAGNMARIDVVRDFFAMLLQKNTLVVSALSCQFISNVPSAILLSQFTQNYPQLLVGVNIGGCGTVISSLASLITLREYVVRDPEGTGKYMKMFCAFNFGFLAFLTLVMSVYFA